METASQASGNKSRNRGSRNSPPREPVPARDRLIDGACAAIAIALVWLVLTHSFADSVLAISPRLSRDLNPGDAAVLMDKVNREFAKIQSPRPAAPAGGETNTDAKARAKISPPAQQPPPAEATQPADAQGPAPDPENIRRLAVRVLREEPTTARAYVMLATVAELGGDKDGAEALMGAAVVLSKREGGAVAWQFEHAIARGDYPAAIRLADILLRVQNLNRQLTPFLTRMFEVPQTRPLVVEILARNPLWRRGFLENVLFGITDPKTPLELFDALKETPNPLTPDDHRKFVNFLADRQAFNVAFYGWLQSLPMEALEHAGYLYNGKFETLPSQYAFDWTFGHGEGGRVERVVRAGEAGRYAARVQFQGGHVGFAPLTQITLLPSGKYKFTGSVSNALNASRGLKWEVRCVGPDNLAIGASEPINNQSKGWTDFSFLIDVPAGKCPAQRVVLMLDASTASESIATGWAEFENLSIQRAN